MEESFHGFFLVGRWAVLQDFGDVPHVLWTLAGNSNLSYKHHTSTVSVSMFYTFLYLNVDRTVHLSDLKLCAIPVVSDIPISTVTENLSSMVWLPL